GADGQGPYLLPQDADVRADQPANRLRLTAVLDRLQQLPPQKKILLVLDATQVPASWPLGMLRNEFAAGLHDAKIKDRIDRMSNLVVLCASDADQRSWASDEFRTTAFTHYLVKGLQGAADGNGDGRITARELYDYVRQKVEQWARGNKDDRQEPLLLPGPDRADEMIVTVVSSSPPS